ncbi:MAG TPA: protein-L-isoaspartate(D-aspartate) O-methyltransferase [Roseiflexaceae bacterium]|nr:protein-L-isoaspartate(D-aspartate) O-methyltransferase [Roseiflexaceae bacterium]HMP40800.1 protein-L-isoaspartate(D-aspartate) O-methyltransferase [Roseiflexaceae bacterium]
MIELLERRGIRDQRVLEAMLRVPRHLFVPPEERTRAYHDCALPLANGQTISQPYIVALMAEALQIAPGDRLLEVGAGSGYAAAVLAEIAGQVFSIERDPDLAVSAAERLHQLGYRNVEIIEGDGTLGLPAYAPFDGIIVSAASPWVPAPLREQLGAGGRLVIPVGGRNEQVLLRLTRADDRMRSERLCDVRFVPLVGGHAWGHDEVLDS